MEVCEGVLRSCLRSGAAVHVRCRQRGAADLQQLTGLVAVQQQGVLDKLYLRERKVCLTQVCLQADDKRQAQAADCCRRLQRTCLGSLSLSTRLPFCVLGCLSNGLAPLIASGDLDEIWIARTCCTQQKMRGSDADDARSCSQATHNLQTKHTRPARPANACKQPHELRPNYSLQSVGRTAGCLHPGSLHLLNRLQRSCRLVGSARAAVSAGARCSMQEQTRC